MKRPRLHFIFASLVLILSTAEWIHSQYRANGALYTRRTSGGFEHYLQVTSENGLLMFEGWSIIDARCPLGLNFHSEPASSNPPPPTTFWQKIGFTFEVGAQRSWFCTMPWWLFSVSAGVSLLMTAVRHRRGIVRSRLSAGACAKCAYDLRASPDRCPECGTLVADGPTIAVPV